MCLRFAHIIALTLLTAACGRGDCPLVAETIDYHRPERYSLPTAATRPGGRLSAESRGLARRLEDKRSVSPVALVDTLIHARLVLHRDPSRVLARSAGAIWKSGWASGCHDFALVAASLLRLLGCPVIFVETVHESALEGRSHHGHVFLEVLEPGGRWVLYDPTNARIWRDEPPGLQELPGGYFVLGRYSDPWEAGLGSSGDLLACMAEGGSS